MSLFERYTYVTGRYAFAFHIIIWDHEWDGRDYAYIHDVNEEQGEKTYHILEKELGVQGKTMEELFRLKYGENYGTEECADDIFRFCNKHNIENKLTVCLL